VPAETRVLRELENAHRALITMHLEKTLKSDRVLRDLRRHELTPPTA
jgi:pentose-5-phosphate-3-epimerase